MDRLDYYYRQKVTEAELDQGFEDAELADRAMMADNGIVGRAAGLDPSQASPTPNISIDVTSGVAYDQAGERVFVPQTENVSVAVDNGGVSTDVSTVGNSKIVSVFVAFDRSLSDPRIDGNNDTVFFNRAESFAFYVKQGAESSGTPTPPTLESGRILIADITRTYGQTQILDADVSTERRQDVIQIAAKTATAALSRGTFEEAIDAILTMLDDHVTGGSLAQPASSITYAGSPNWKDSTSIASGSVEDAIDQIVADLSATTSLDDGAQKIGIYAETIGATWGWSDGSVHSAIHSVASAGEGLWQALQNNGPSTDGAGLIGALANGSYLQGTVRSQLNQLLSTSATTGGSVIVRHPQVTGTDTGSVLPSGTLLDFLKLLMLSPSDSGLVTDAGSALVYSPTTLSSGDKTVDQVIADLAGVVTSLEATRIHHVRNSVDDTSSFAEPLGGPGTIVRPSGNLGTLFTQAAASASGGIAARTAYLESGQYTSGGPWTITAGNSWHLIGGMGKSGGAGGSAGYAGLATLLDDDLNWYPEDGDALVLENIFFGCALTIHAPASGSYDLILVNTDVANLYIEGGATDKLPTIQASALPNSFNGAHRPRMKINLYNGIETNGNEAIELRAHGYRIGSLSSSVVPIKAFDIRECEIEATDFEILDSGYLCSIRESYFLSGSDFAKRGSSAAATVVLDAFTNYAIKAVTTTNSGGHTFQVWNDTVAFA